MKWLYSDIVLVLQCVSARFQVIPGLKIWLIKTSETGCNHILKVFLGIITK